MAIQLRKNAIKNYFRIRSDTNRIAMNKATASARKIIKKAKRDSWHSFCSKININTPLSTVYKFFKRMSGKYTPISYPITLNNAPINNDSTIANTFADHFENTLKSNFIPENQEQLLMNIQINCETGNNLPYNNNLTLPEITKTINSVNINSTMGHDNIHNKMIKMLPIQFINLLFITLNNL